MCSVVVELIGCAYELGEEVVGLLQLAMNGPMKVL
jgi:hypothetical protein